MLHCLIPDEEVSEIGEPRNANSKKNNIIKRIIRKQPPAIIGAGVP